MLNVDKLKKCMANKGMTAETLAEAIEIDRATFYRKIARSECAFTVEQARRISDVLELSGADFMDIFLPEMSH